MGIPFADLSGAYAWLDGQVNYEARLNAVAYNDKTFELEAFARRLERLGNPHGALRTVHIAGTRGKGSAALALEALLGACGLRTAVYTSPHLTEYRERIRVDGAPISGELFAELLGEVAAAGGAGEGSGPERGERAFKTVFENLTALFFLAARRCAVDWAIVETGLGGRLDSTNVLPPGPVLLTRIGLEHTHLLGDTIEKIAGEKAAILKAGGWGVMAAQAVAEGPGVSAEEVFQNRAHAVEARLDAAPALCPLRAVEARPGGLRVELDFEGRPLTLNLPLYGAFQAENMQNALAVFARLRQEGQIPRISDEQIVGALAGLRIPGRMERVSERPELYVDGGHCPTAAAALARTMALHFGDEPAGLIVAMMQDKDHDGFFRELARWPGWAWVWCYRGDSPRAMDAPALAQAARGHFGQVSAFENLEQILELLGRPADKVMRVVATGSLHTVARLESWGAVHGSPRFKNQAPAQAEQDADR